MAINSRLTLDNKQFRAALQESAGAIGALVADASIRFQSLYAQTDALNARLSKGIGRFASDLQSMGKTLTLAVSLPLLGLAGASISAYGEIDSLKRGLFSIEKTAENTEARFNSLKEVAALPGLGLEEAVKGDIRLRAVGISADLSKKSLLEFGNAIALTGGGKANLDRVTTQLSQMSAKSKVLAQDLKPIIEAAPSVSQALQKMFGTVDSEEISKKLKAKGLNSTDFIGILVNEMEKLPRVSGGIKNAMENMGDSLKVAGYEFGQILDKTFGLSDILNGLGNTLNNAVTWFKSLSPEIQKGALAFGGMLAVVGPLILGIGSIASMFASGGILAGGLAAITGPIGIAALAIVGLGTVIFANWDAIKKVLKDTGIWDGLATVVQGTVDLVTGAFSMLKKVVGLAFAYMKKTLNDDTYGVFKIMGTVISTALTVAGNLLSVFGKILKNDWTGVWDGIQNIVKSAWNGIITVIATGEKAVLGISAKLLNAVGATDNASMFTRMSAEVDSFANTVKFKVPEATSILGNLGKALDSALKGGGGTNTTPDFKSGGGEGEDKAKKPKTVTDPSKYFQRQFEDFKKDIQVFKSKIQMEMSQIKFDQKEFDLNFKIKPLALDTSGLQRIKDILANSGDLFPTTSIAKNFAQFDAIITEQAQKLYANTDLTLNQAKAKVAELWAGVGGAAKQAQDSILQGFAQNVGAFIGGGQSLSSAISNIGASVLGGLGDFFISIGSQIVAAAPLFTAISRFLKTALTNPAAGALGLVAGLGLIALGAGMKALGSSLSATSQSYTSGGGSSSGGGGSGFTNPYTQTNTSTLEYKPIEVLIKGESVTRGSDLVTTYTNQTSYNSRVKRKR